MATAAVGISFGSDSCVVAVTNTSGVPQVYANADGDRVTPTYTAFIEGEVLHGAAARSAFVRQPVQSVPYLLPLLSAEVVNNGDLQPKCEVEVVTENGDEKVVLPTADGEGVLAGGLPKRDAEDSAVPHYTAELLKSFLGDLKTKTIDGPVSGRPVSCLCVSVPRYMDQATVRSAIEGAGLAKEVRVIYDDVAAAVAHEIGNTGATAVGPTGAIPKDRSDVLVIDWGANVLSASILRLEGGAYRLLAHSHKFGCGGTALDKALAKVCCEIFMKKTRLDASENGRSMRKLLLALDGVRKTLTMSTMSPINVEAFCDGMDFRDSFSRVKLDMTIRDSGLLDKFSALVKDTVDKVDPTENVNVNHIVLSGGLLRTQFIANSVKNLLQTLVPGGETASVHDNIPFDEVSALGACSEAFLTTATFSSLTQPSVELALVKKTRPVDPTVKSSDSVTVEGLEGAVALYTGAEAFAKTAKRVDAAKVQALVVVNPASPTANARKEFGEVAAAQGAYEIALNQMYVVAPRGAPLPFSSPLVEAATGAAVLPLAVVATSETHAYVVPLLKRPHKLATANFKLLLTAEKNAAVAAVAIVEDDGKGGIKSVARSEW